MYGKWFWKIIIVAISRKISITVIFQKIIKRKTAERQHISNIRAGVQHQLGDQERKENRHHTDNIHNNIDSGNGDVVEDKSKPMKTKGKVYGRDDELEAGE
jgi:hypothetical protein